jgi:isocitrate lyase
MRTAILLLFAACLRAQLPEPSALLAEVKANQHKLEEIRENYTFHLLRRTDQLDKNGVILKTASMEREVFFINGRRIARLVKKDGRDLTPAEDKAEQDRVRKLVESVMKGGRGGGPPPGGRAGEISDILAVVIISNPRRVDFNGRPSLAYDFNGDPKAHSHDMEQSAAKKMSGTIWFDEADRQVARLEVRFDDNFHIGGGILASVQKGSSMEFEQAPVGDGLWMQTSSAQHLDARLMVKKFREDVHIKAFEFKRFNTGVIQQPGPPSK